MGIRILATVILSVLLMSSASAETEKDRVKCQQMLDEAGARHLTRANKTLGKHQEKIGALLDKAYSDLQSQGKAVDAVQDVIDRLTERHGMDRARFVYIEEFIDKVTGVNRRESAAFMCPDKKRVRAHFDTNLTRYEKRLDNLRSDVAARLDIERLAPDEGLVIIAFNTNQPVDEVRINKRGTLGGAIKFGPTPIGEFFRVMRVTEGTYNWDLITRRLGDYIYMHDYGKRDMTFEVEAGKLNYAGVFIYEMSGFNWASGTLNDRLTVVLTVMEQRFPELLEQYEVANGLFPDDRFVQFYLQEKQQSLREQANET